MDNGQCLVSESVVLVKQEPKVVELALTGGNLWKI